MTEHWCKEHECKFYKNEKDGKTWYSHKRKGDSGYCNEPKETGEKAEPTETKVPGKTAIPPVTVSTKAQMTPEDWSLKDKITRKSIERQTALNAAIEIAKGYISQGASPENLTPHIISTAKKFELYLETGVDIATIAQGKEAKGKLVGNLSSE